jgi:hypothetical protein
LTLFCRYGIKILSIDGTTNERRVNTVKHVARD